MNYTVILSLGKGSLEEGFPDVSVRISRITGNCSIFEAGGSLPSKIQLAQIYNEWQKLYLLSLKTKIYTRESRLDIGTDNKIETFHFSKIKFQKLCEQLKTEINDWFNSQEFNHINSQLVTHLNDSDEIQFIIETDNQLALNIPWHLWEFFGKYPKSDLIVSLPSCKPLKATSRKKNKEVNILAIFGDREGINLKYDLEALESLKNSSNNKVKITRLDEPNREEIDEKLRQGSWNILFFAGHSSSQNKGTIRINEKESLTLEELKNPLAKAIKNGLELAIFNSCDGIELAKFLLTDLHLSRVIVMRQSVPDKVAQKFLKHFLTAFLQNKSLSLSIREAREKLQSLEAEFPCATWLPIIFQNSATLKPLFWQDLISNNSHSIIPAVGGISLSLIALIIIAVNHIPFANPKATVVISDKPEKTINKTEKNNPITFECQHLYKTPTTVAIVNNQPKQFIRWVSDVGKDAGYTPEKRCQEVTPRLNAQFASGANYVTHWLMNNNPVICTTDKQGAGCRDLLFTLDWQNSNPKIVVEDIFMLGNSNFAGIPLRQ